MNRHIEKKVFDASEACSMDVQAAVGGFCESIELSFHLLIQIQSKKTEVLSGSHRY
jgi:hypothetical protein